MVESDFSTDELFPERLRQARELRGFAPGDLADRTGIPGSSISHFEAGRRKPSFDSLRKLATTLGVSTDYLLGLADNPAPDSAKDMLFRNAQTLTDGDRVLASDFIEMLRRRSRRR